jgi:hypothetical protein
MKCKRCEAEVANDKVITLARAHWGWTLAPDSGLGDDGYGPIPGYWYACPDCSDEDHKDAFSFALRKAKDRPSQGRQEGRS